MSEIWYLVVISFWVRGFPVEVSASSSMLQRFLMVLGVFSSFMVMKIVVRSSFVNLTVYFLFMVISYNYRIQPTLIYNVVKAIFDKTKNKFTKNNNKIQKLSPKKKH